MPYVTGQTNSTDFPKQSATQSALGGGNDAFVSEISASGSQLLFSTYLGGALNENTNTPGANLAAIGSIAVSAGANIYVTGNTASTNFPATAGAKQTASGGGNDAFVAKYSVTVTGPDFTIAGTALAGVTQGGSTTSTITIAALNGYTGTVNFTCSVASVSGGSPLPTCSIPNAVSGGAGTSTLTVHTTGAAHAMYRGGTASFTPCGCRSSGCRWWACGLALPTHEARSVGLPASRTGHGMLFFLPACGGSSNKRRRRRWLLGLYSHGQLHRDGHRDGCHHLTHSTPGVTLTVN